MKLLKNFLPYVDVIKVADNELEFLTGTTNIEEALKKDFSHMKVVLYTKGEHGAEVYYENHKVVTEIPNIKAVDTTGAGGCFRWFILIEITKS